MFTESPGGSGEGPQGGDQHPEDRPQAGRLPQRSLRQEAGERGRDG